MKTIKKKNQTEKFQVKEIYSKVKSLWQAVKEGNIINKQWNIKDFSSFMKNMKISSFKLKFCKGFISI